MVERLGLPDTIDRCMSHYIQSQDDRTPEALRHPVGIAEGGNGVNYVPQEEDRMSGCGVEVSLVSPTVTSVPL